MNDEITEVYNVLKDNPKVVLSFVKVDGTERHIVSSLNRNTYSNISESDVENAIDNDSRLLHFFDTEDMLWKCMRQENLIDYNVL